MTTEVNLTAASDARTQGAEVDAAYRTRRYSQLTSVVARTRLGVSHGILSKAGDAERVVDRRSVVTILMERALNSFCYCILTESPATIDELVKTGMETAFVMRRG